MTTEDDTMPMDKLPTSQQEITSALFVAFVAGMAGFARLVYGKDDLTWRRVIGSIIIAMVTGLGVYAAIVQGTATPISGYYAVAVGIASGLFTDDVLRRIQQYIATKKGPGES